MLPSLGLPACAHKEVELGARTSFYRDKELKQLHQGCLPVQKEAKLGEENKFFYDEELKCWREQGAAAPVLAPPPPRAARRLPGCSRGAAAHW